MLVTKITSGKSMVPTQITGASVGTFWYYKYPKITTYSNIVYSYTTAKNYGMLREIVIADCAAKQLPSNNCYHCIK